MTRFPTSYQIARSELCEITKKGLGTPHYQFLQLPTSLEGVCGYDVHLTPNQSRKLRRAFESAGYKAEISGGGFRYSFSSRTHHNVGLTIVEGDGRTRAFLWAFEEGSGAR